MVRGGRLVFMELSLWMQCGRQVPFFLRFNENRSCYLYSGRSLARFRGGQCGTAWRQIDGARPDRAASSLVNLLEFAPIGGKRRSSSGATGSYPRPHLEDSNWQICVKSAITQVKQLF